MAAAGYLPAGMVLIVQFLDGAVYGRLNVSDSQAAEFFTAPSKGKYLAQLPGPSVLLSTGTAAAAPAPAAPLTEEDKQLQSYQETEGCCEKTVPAYLGKPESKTATLFTCPRCGVEWRPTMKGVLRHWAPAIPLAIARRRP